MRSGSQVEVTSTILPAAARDERALDHFLDLLGVEHRHHDRLAFLRDIGKRTGLRAEICQPRVLRRVDVVSRSP